uniref:Uncharacterized protein n=1 Tax=Pavo cristatus TaxID=9049 RepID=A0A8C9EWN6_PAVCR
MGSVYLSLCLRSVRLFEPKGVLTTEHSGVQQPLSSCVRPSVTRATGKMQHLVVCTARLSIKWLGKTKNSSQMRLELENTRRFHVWLSNILGFDMSHLCMHIIHIPICCVCRNDILPFFLRVAF